MKITHPVPFALAIGLAYGFSRGAAAAPETSAPIDLGGVWKFNRELSDNPGQKMMEAMRNAGNFGGRGRGGPGGGGGGMGGPGGGGGRGGGGRGGGGGEQGGPGGGAGRGGRGPGGAGGGMMGGEPPLDGAPEGDRPQEPGVEGQGGQGPRGEGQGGQRPPQPQRDSEGGGDNDAGARRRGRGMGPVPSRQFKIEQEGDNLAFRTEGNLRLLHSDGQKRAKEGDGGRQDVTARFIKGALVIETKAERGGKRKETYTLREDKKLQIDFDIEGSGPMPGMRFKLVYDAATPPLV